MNLNELLRGLPSVDELLNTLEPSGAPRPLVVDAAREAIDSVRRSILDGQSPDVSVDALAGLAATLINEKTSNRLVNIINATGVVIHTNLGRSVLPEAAADNALRVSTGYSNLEFDLDTGARGSRHSHLKSLIRLTTGAEDGIAVNNNAAAVLLCLYALAYGREVIVSRGELVEIGGSFRVPDVMEQGGATLREVGTTNKTHPWDYEQAVNENTGLILKVHRSNFRMSGFIEEVPLDRLCKIGAKMKVPVMYDLGSGSIVDLKPYGIYDEPPVNEIIRDGVDVVTLSGDKLIGGPQAGIIAGRKKYIDIIKKHPIARAVRIDKLTLAALETTMMLSIDAAQAVRTIPTLSMLSEQAESIKKRAMKLKGTLRRANFPARVLEVVKDVSRAGGGSLPELDLPTWVVSILPAGVLSAGEFQKRLRKAGTPVVSRVREDRVIFDLRTVRDVELSALTRSSIEASKE